jgi:hypothetical protein
MERTVRSGPCKGTGLADTVQKTSTNNTGYQRKMHTTTIPGHSSSPNAIRCRHIPNPTTEHRQTNEQQQHHTSHHKQACDDTTKGGNHDNRSDEDHSNRHPRSDGQPPAIPSTSRQTSPPSSYMTCDPTPNTPPTQTCQQHSQPTGKATPHTATRPHAQIPNTPKGDRDHQSHMIHHRLDTKKHNPHRK